MKNLNKKQLARLDQFLDTFHLESATMKEGTKNVFVIECGEGTMTIQINDKTILNFILNGIKLERNEVYPWDK